MAKALPCLLLVLGTLASVHFVWQPAFLLPSSQKTSEVSCETKASLRSQVRCSQVPPSTTGSSNVVPCVIGALAVLGLATAKVRSSKTQMQAGGCPFTAMTGAMSSVTGAISGAHHGMKARGGEEQIKVKTQHNWWPNKLDLGVLSVAEGDNNPTSTRKAYSYADEFKKLDLEALKKDVFECMTNSQDWWPADYGHYGPFFIRMAWHAAGTYRVGDGRGGANTGNLRFAPLNSWPDNGNLDKAKRLLWPIKKKYGQKVSWADLMIFAGNCAMESMGCPPFGFAGGREDIWAPEEDVYWGPEDSWLADERHPTGTEDIIGTLGAVQMGLIYVNPEGPGANPEPLLAAKDMRETFGRMAMNDEETVALVAGGHTFGKAHGAADPGLYVGPEPEGASIESMGFGWTSSFESGKGEHAITSGLEGAWTVNPIKWDNGYFENLFKYEWEKTKSPAGATQWIPTDPAARELVPDAHNPSKKHAPIMFTTDLALRFDPIYGPIAKRFADNPEEFTLAYAKAWYKLTHRDMGPIARCLGSMVAPQQIWQDPIPAGTQVAESEIEGLKGKILASGLSTSQLVKAAWASASTYRCTDHRGGANGGRIRFAPIKDWAANDPADLSQVLEKLEGIKAGTSMSIADLIVLGGCAAIEDAAKKGGFSVKVPFSSGRGDATLEDTDLASFGVLEPKADGFRNFGGIKGVPSEELLVDKAHLLKLAAPEMAVLVAGMRVLGGNSGGSDVGVLTDRPGTLSNDFFVNLLDMSTTWKATDDENLFEGCDYASGAVKYKGSRVDLVFGSNSELRALSEYYACDDSAQAFVDDFVAAWAKVMNADRFDLKA